MLVRILHGVTLEAKAYEYIEVLNKTGMKEYCATQGNLGAYVLRRIEGDEAHFLTITFWDSVESIKKFAGEEYEKARYYPEDAEYLLEFEEKVAHYDVRFSVEP
jgi:heme-degrading monooxygenase HmoA